jgi:Bacterial Ig domain
MIVLSAALSVGKRMPLDSQIIVPGSNETTLQAGQRSTPKSSDPCRPPVHNRVACENTLPGDPSSDWSVPGAGDLSLQGFVTDQSVNAGQTIRLKISTTARTYHFDIIRFGWYQGKGARKVASGLRPSASLPQLQPPCTVDRTNTTGLVDCSNWAESASWAVPADAVSGIYAAHLIRDDMPGSSYVFFVVRSDVSRSAIVYQTSDVAREAYNRYGGNSLYFCSVACPPGHPLEYKGAYKVSWNRPDIAAALGPQQSFFGAEFDMVEFLEANGYDVSYISGVDTDRYGSLLTNHKIFIDSGHDEYWSGPQRANVERAANAGVNLAFFSGDSIFWKVRYEKAADGTGGPYRTLVSYKETHFNTRVDPSDPPTWTGTWRDGRFSPPADGGQPENALMGTMYTVDPPDTFAIQVPAADGKLRFWRNTSIAHLSPRAVATLAAGTLGYEWDEDVDNGFRPAGNIDLSTTTEHVAAKLVNPGNATVPGVATHHLTLHRMPSGALVFGAGTVQWSWGLEGNPEGSGRPDIRMEQATVNLLADMGVQPATLIGGLVAATASADTVPPTSHFASPSPTSVPTVGTTVTIAGTAADAGGGRVGGVEVSTDGGTSWHPASGREQWTYSWQVQAAGRFKIESRATDDSANTELPGSGIVVTVKASGPG